MEARATDARAAVLNGGDIAEYAGVRTSAENVLNGPRCQIANPVRMNWNVRHPASDLGPQDHSVEGGHGPLPAIWSRRF